MSCFCQGPALADNINLSRNYTVTTLIRMGEPCENSYLLMKTRNNVHIRLINELSLSFLSCPSDMKGLMLASVSFCLNL